MVIASVAQDQMVQERPLPFPPDPSQQRPSLYSDKLKTSVTWDNRLKRNVLEITLEKEEDSFVDLGAEAIFRLFKTLGINTEKDVEGYFQKSKSIHVWLINGIPLDKFCKSESIRVTNKIKTGFIRPAGKKEVMVTLSGLEFNTPDTFVMEYLGKFGTVVTSSVIYDKYKEGPFKGKYNGERKYQVDFTKSKISMGTFHIIDGSRVRVFYPGNKKTCGRCHNQANLCKGEAVAKTCEENGGSRVDLVDHMRILWAQVDFQPHDFHLETGDDNNITNDATINHRTKFSPNIARPIPSAEGRNKYDGVSIKNFPKEAKKMEVIEFLKSKGLPEEFPNENIVFGTHGNVELMKMTSQTCQELISNIHFVTSQQTFFGKPIYCRATRDLTPEKPTEKNPVDDEKKDEETKQNEAAALVIEDKRTEPVGDEENGFVFKTVDMREPLANINSKLLNGSEESSEEEEEVPNPALKFLKNPKTPASASKKQKKRERPTPSGTSDKKIEKKTKTA